MCNYVIGSMVLCLSVAIGGWTDGRADEPKQLTDTEISKLLVGKWSADEVTENGVKIKGINHYRKNGTSSSTGTLTFGEESLKIELSGSWMVSNGLIIGTVTKTNIPDLIKKGHMFKDKVLSIDKATLSYKTEKGKTTVRKRLSD